MVTHGISQLCNSFPSKKRAIMQKQLTDLTVQKLPPGTYHDTKTPAFGIRVGKNRRTWFCTHAVTRKRQPLGHYPAMSLAEARKRALVTLGSPMQEKPQLSFPDAVEAFLALPRWRPASKRVLTSSLKHFTWKRNLDKITHEDVAQALDAIKGHSARAHALKDIRTFFNWCVPRYLSQSPCTGLKMDAQPSRERVLTDDEVKAIWKASEGTFGTIVKLLLLTGQRKMEIGTLRWSDLTDSTITIRAEVAKNGKDSVIPLGEFAKSLLPPKTNGYLFRSAKDNDELYNGYTFHVKQLQKASGTSGWTIHDLRRTFATKHAELGTPIHVVEKLLNHVSGSLAGVAGVYNRYSYFSEMQTAVDNYEQFIKKLVS